MVKKSLLALALALPAFGVQAQGQPGPKPIVPRYAVDAVPRNLTAHPPGAGCTIQNNNTTSPLAPGANDDALFKLLSAQSRCPQNALIFRELLLANKLAPRPTMVANRGFHNPLPQGSFSFFETVTGSYGGQALAPGDWFFGHFTAASIDSTAATSTLVPQQSATLDNLLLETLIWDPKKQMFNFYEIRGTGQGGVWFYRGDSADIQADIQNLYRAYDTSQPVFMGPLVAGVATLPRLRCSGCHVNGGPIMKELKAPHDSWWTAARPLDLGALRIAPEFKPLVDNVVSANDFSSWVKAGAAKLFASAPYWNRRTTLPLQEQLRPLFCEQEVNLESDTQPLQGPAQDILAPMGAFVDQRLVPDIPGVTIRKDRYVAALNLFQSVFTDYQNNSVQPINQIDADHAFETPVKSHTDMLLADRMVASGLIDEKFVYDVIAVDMTRPMFSAARCGLLQLVPGSAPTPDWKALFERNLAGSDLPAAKELLAHLRDPARSPAYHRARAKALVTLVQTHADKLQPAVNGYVRLLTQRRIAVYQAQVSQHPQGQIFEPGFRLIFPTMQLFAKNQQQIAYGGVPGQYWLNPATGLVELTR
jgi:hypothetical protein